jgi:hypothetical protein
LSKRASSRSKRLQGLKKLQFLRPAGEHLREGSDGLHGSYLRLAGSQRVNRAEQATNESWGQLGHPDPDARPLGRDVISPGHAHKSCTGHESLSRGICTSKSVKSAGFQTLGRVAYTVRIRARRTAPAARQEAPWT